MRAWWLGGVVAGIAVACGTRAPHPPYSAHASSELVEVPFPPPPARVETVPEQPASGAMWIDGEWTWRGRKWFWKSGYWAPPPSGATYSPWQMTRNGAGTLFFAPGTWRDAKGEVIAPPAVLALGSARLQPVVDPEGATEVTGRNLAPDGGPLRRDGGG